MKISSHHVNRIYRENVPIPLLNNLAEDDEPNVRWDAAIALAKMGENRKHPNY